MFRRKKKEPTLVEQTVTAIDRVTTEVNDLREERVMALSSFRDTANWLAKINEDLDSKAALCGSMIGQLQAAQESITRQVEDNDKVRMKILDIIGE